MKNKLSSALLVFCITFLALGNNAFALWPFDKKKPAIITTVTNTVATHSVNLNRSWTYVGRVATPPEHPYTASSYAIFIPCFGLEYCSERQQAVDTMRHNGLVAFITYELSNSATNRGFLGSDFGAWLNAQAKAGQTVDQIAVQIRGTHYYSRIRFVDITIDQYVSSDSNISKSSYFAMGNLMYDPIPHELTIVRTNLIEQIHEKTNVSSIRVIINFTNTITITNEVKAVPKVSPASGPTSMDSAKQQQSGADRAITPPKRASPKPTYTIFKNGQMMGVTTNAGITNYISGNKKTGK